MRCLCLRDELLTKALDPYSDFLNDVPNWEVIRDFADVLSVQPLNGCGDVWLLAAFVTAVAKLKAAFDYAEHLGSIMLALVSKKINRHLFIISLQRSSFQTTMLF